LQDLTEKSALPTAMHRATLACINFRSAHALVCIAVDDAEMGEVSVPMSDPTERSNLNKRRHELSVSLLEASLSFAASLAKELDDLIERQPNRSSTFFPRILAHAPDEPSWTHTNQFILVLGGLSFFLYVVDWLLFKRGDEALRVAIFDPIAASLDDVLTNMRNKMSPNEPITKDYTHDVIAELHARYATAPSPFGMDDPMDRTSAVWLAADAIIENINNSGEMFGAAIVSELLRSLSALELPGRIAVLAALSMDVRASKNGT
jgi:hypothetical protein